MKLGEKFQSLKEKGEGALLGYITLGDPTPEESFRIAQELIDSGGVDVLELGVPFSDPIADCPVIQAAVDRALRAGMNTDKAFEIAGRLDKKVPVIYLTYYNIVLQRGVERFAEDCAKAGISGLIIADLPFEESAETRAACKRNGVDYIHIVTPNTPPDRMRMILADASGFVYVVSNMGVTGTHAELPAGLRETVGRAIDNAGGVPVAVGFGISSPAHVRALLGMGASGAIVGSAIVGRIGEGMSVADLCDFVRSLKAATRKEYPGILAT